MHNRWLRIFCVTGLFCLSHTLWAEAGTSLKKVNGRVYAPAVEMTGPNGESVLLVGMSHRGFQSYYQRVNAAITDWAAAGEPGQKTVVLREFFTAQGAVYDNAGPEVSQDLVDRLPEIDFESASFRAMDDEKLKPWLEAFHMKKTAPVLDVDGRTLRPAYYAERNRTACADAARAGGACQWEAFDVPDSATVENAEGDLQVDQWPAGLQFLASALFRGEGWKVRVNNPVRRQAVDAAFRLVTNFRNEQLFGVLQARLAAGQKRFVLPWGAVHIQGLYKMLIEAGYQTRAVRDIMVMDTTDFGRWPDLDETYENYFYKLSDHYRFQDEAIERHVAEL